MIEWLIIGAIFGGLAAAFWDSIKDWIRGIAYKLKKYSRLFLEKISSSKYRVMIEGETQIIDASEVPEEIRKRVSYSQVDITAEARKAGILEL